EPVGTGAQGNLSFTAMFTRTPVLYCSHQTLTSANRPVVLRRSRTMSSVSISSVSPIETPATERTVDSSVRLLPRMRTSVISSPTASARPGARAVPNPITHASNVARVGDVRERMSPKHKGPRDIRKQRAFAYIDVMKQKPDLRLADRVASHAAASGG